MECGHRPRRQRVLHHDVIAAARRGGAHFSITGRMNPAVATAISGVKESAWTPIRYPNAIWDQDVNRFISDAQVAEVAFTAFTSRRQSEHISGRLIVRRVKRLTPKDVGPGQGELFAQYRHHGVFTDSPLTMLRPRSITAATGRVPDVQRWRQRHVRMRRILEIVRVLRADLRGTGSTRCGTSRGLVRPPNVAGRRRRWPRRRSSGRHSRRSVAGSP